MPGMTTVADISTNLGASDIVTAVMRHAIAVSSLYQLCTPVDVPNLTGTIPVSAAGAVTEDVEELETTDIDGGSFTAVTFELKKDRVKLAMSDESKYRSRAGSPLQIQITDAGQQLASILDKKVIKALETTPQTTSTSGAWSTVTNNPLKDIATAVSNIRPYKADFVVMTKEVWGDWIGNDLFKNIVQSGIQPTMEKAVGMIPGLNLNIFVDTEGYQTADTLLVGASKACAAYGRGPIEVHTERNSDMGAEIYYLDVWRQVKSPLFLNSSTKNKAVYQITSVSD